MFLNLSRFSALRNASISKLYNPALSCVVSTLFQLHDRMMLVHLFYLSLSTYASQFIHFQKAKTNKNVSLSNYSIYLYNLQSKVQNLTYTLFCQAPSFLPLHLYPVPYIYNFLSISRSMSLRASRIEEKA